MVHATCSLDTTAAVVVVVVLVVVVVVDVGLVVARFERRKRRRTENVSGIGLKCAIFKVNGTFLIGI